MLFPEPNRSEFIESCEAAGVLDFQCQFNVTILDSSWIVFESFILPCFLMFSALQVASLFYHIFNRFQDSDLVSPFDRVFRTLVKLNFWRRSDPQIEHNIFKSIWFKRSLTSEIYSFIRNSGFDIPFRVVAVSLDRLKRKGFIDYDNFYSASGQQSRRWFLTDSGIQYCAQSSDFKPKQLELDYKGFAFFIYPLPECCQVFPQQKTVYASSNYFKDPDNFVKLCTLIDITINPSKEVNDNV